MAGRAQGRGKVSFHDALPLNPAASSTQASLLRRLRRQRQVGALCRISRLMFELLDELDRRYHLGPDLDARLQRYTALDPHILRALGADRFPAVPTRVIRGAP
jgi:hypothetical protein